MKLSLDHAQRLNLHALMGAQRVTVDELRLFWRLQDRLDLTDDEKKKIGYRVQDVNGMQQVGWDNNASLPLKDFEFTEDEFSRLEKLVKGWQPGFMATMDRRWLEPLLAQLEHVSNGSNPAKKK